MKLAIVCSLTVLISASAQITEADYQRASGLREKMGALAINVTGPITWIDSTDRFWYRKTVAGGHEFMIGDAEKLTKARAFDHEKLAASLSAASGEQYKAFALPFQEITFADRERAIQFAIAGFDWRCELSNYDCKKIGATRAFGAGGRGPDAEENPSEFENDVEDGMVSPQQGQGGGRGGAMPQATSKT